MPTKIIDRPARAKTCCFIGVLKGYFGFYFDSGLYSLKEMLKNCKHCQDSVKVALR
jgi:hypothetical protein